MKRVGYIVAGILLSGAVVCAGQLPDQYGFNHQESSDPTATYHPAWRTATRTTTATRPAAKSTPPSANVYQPSMTFNPYLTQGGVANPYLAMRTGYPSYTSSSIPSLMMPNTGLNIPQTPALNFHWNPTHQQPVESSQMRGMVVRRWQPHVDRKQSEWMKMVANDQSLQAIENEKAMQFHQKR